MCLVKEKKVGGRAGQKRQKGQKAKRGGEGGAKDFDLDLGSPRVGEWRSGGGAVYYLVDEALLLVKEGHLVARVQQESDPSPWVENEGFLFILQCFIQRVGCTTSQPSTNPRLPKPLTRRLMMTMSC